MVTQALKTISKAEKELEHIAGDCNSQDPADQTAKEMRRLAETVTFSAVKATEQWGKQVLEKTKEITEEISL